MTMVKDALSYLNTIVTLMFYLLIAGFNPIWRETMEFKLNLPELDILLISVMDKEQISDDDLTGYQVLLVNSLKPGMLIYLYKFSKSKEFYFFLGYAHIPLNSPEGKLMPASTLFVHVSIHDDPLNS